MDGAVQKERNRDRRDLPEKWYKPINLLPNEKEMGNGQGTKMSVKKYRF